MQQIPPEMCSIRNSFPSNNECCSEEVLVMLEAKFSSMSGALLRRSFSEKVGKYMRTLGDYDLLTIDD